MWAWRGIIPGSERTTEAQVVRGFPVERVINRAFRQILPLRLSTVTLRRGNGARRASTPGQVCTPMRARSASEKRASTSMLSATKSRNSPRDGSSLQHSRHSVKSICTLSAPASKAERMSFSHSFTGSARKESRE